MRIVRLAFLLCVLAQPALDANGWFPKFNPSGTHLASGSGSLSLDGSELGIVGWGPQWLSDTEIVFTDAHGSLAKYSITTGQIVTLQATGYNELAAGGGKWAGWRPDALQTSDGTSIEGAGDPTLNADGRLGYVDPRGASMKRVIVDGQTYDACACGELSISRTLAVWTHFVGPNAGTWFKVIGGLNAPQKVATPNPAEEYRPIAIDTPEGPWVGNHTQTGLIVRPASATDAHGYRYDNGGQAYYPDWVYRDGAILAAFSDQDGTLQTHAFPLSAPRVDLAAKPAPAPPPTPTPEPTPDPDPEPIPGDPTTCDGFSVTIYDYPATLRVGQQATIALTFTPPKKGALTRAGGDLLGDGKDGWYISGDLGALREAHITITAMVAGRFNLHGIADTESCHAETGRERWVVVTR